MRTRVFLTAAVVLALAGFTGVATIASFSAETTNPTNKFATGTLVLTNTKTAGSGTCLSTAAKTLSDFATNYGAGSPITIGSGLASGASGYFTISVQLASTAGNSLQGRSAAADLTWHLDQ